MSMDFEDRIRRAVSSREFDAAFGLWQEFVAAMGEKQRRRELTLSDIGAARDLCAWTLVAAQCARAHAQRRLNEFKSASDAAHAYSQMARVIR